MKRVLTRSCFVLAFCLILLSNSFAQEATDTLPRRIVQVTGEAQINVVPDEVILTLGVETWNPSLDEAKKQNDEIIKKALAVTEEFKIDDKDVQTEYINVVPSYESIYDPNSKLNRNTLTGYYVRKTISIQLKDVTKFEDLLAKELKAGVNYVHGVQFKTTELRKYRDQARSIAIKAAQDKADALALELGVRVGKPTMITEYGGGWWSGYSGWWGGGYSSNSQIVMQNAVSSSSSGSDIDGTIALGQIKVSATVSVSFELE